MDATESEELLSLIRDLVQIETENPPGNESDCANYVLNWFQERGIRAEQVYEPFEDRPQVVAQVGEGDPTVVLNGHMDVISPGEHGEWTYPPYSATIEDRTLYGRGSVDMKSGLGIGMYTLSSLKTRVEEDELEGSITLQAVVGGEQAEPGTKSLLELGYGGDYAVVLEPTRMKTATSEKGSAWYEITIPGEPVHASRPQQGVNANEHARTIMEELDEYDEYLRQRQDELVGKRFATVTKLNSSNEAVGVLPDKVVMTLDRRILPDESVQEVDTEIDEKLQSIEQKHGIETSWERLTNYSSGWSDPESKVVKALQQEAWEEQNIEREAIGLIFSSDMSAFANKGIDAVVWGPGDHQQAHTIDEHIPIKDIEAGFNVLERSIVRLLSS
jgi:succinyl-diaminopimelate desuccinylase